VGRIDRALGASRSRLTARHDEVYDGIVRAIKMLTCQHVKTYRLWVDYAAALAFEANKASRSTSASADIGRPKK
jgi:hypothetical protein